MSECGEGDEEANTYERLPIHRPKNVPRVECTHGKNVTTSGENAGTPPCEHFSTHVCAAEYSKCFTIAVSKNIKIITKKLWHEIQAGGCECAISNE